MHPIPGPTHPRPAGPKTKTWIRARGAETAPPPPPQTKIKTTKGIGELVARYLALRHGVSVEEGRARCFYLDSKGLVGFRGWRSNLGQTLVVFLVICAYGAPPTGFADPRPSLPLHPADPSRAAPNPPHPTRPPTPQVCASRRPSLQHHKLPFAHDVPYCADLRSAVGQLRPTALIGVSTIGGAFKEGIVRAMAEMNVRAVVWGAGVGGGGFGGRVAGARRGRAGGGGRAGPARSRLGGG
jgi:hypothetical protein